MPKTELRTRAYRGQFDTAVKSWLKSNLPSLVTLYKDFHQHPELSWCEKRTSRIVAAALRKAGCKVVDKIGGYGVAGVLSNGKGPVVLLRGDMDALPVTEETGVSYTSTVPGVMHACGHDVHSTTITAVAAALAASRQLWRGTIIFIGQPAEEVAGGARAMVEDGLFKKVPRPHACAALHVDTDTHVGEIALVPGWFTANTDSVDIVIHGKGGHGAAPNLAQDPIVAAAHVINALQTIVTRRVDPIDPVVITVGSIHAGQKHNIIPSQAQMQLTVRTFDKKVRRQVLKDIKSVTTQAARAAGCSAAPEVKIGVEYTSALYNDPALSAHAEAVFSNIVGTGHVVKLRPTAGGEDFSVFPDYLCVPALMYGVGTIPKGKKSAPALHSSHYALEPAAVLDLSVRSMCALALTLLGD